MRSSSVKHTAASSSSTDDAAAVVDIAKKHGVPARAIGTVRSLATGVVIRHRGEVFRIATERLADAYHDAIPSIMNGSPQAVAAEQLEGVAL